MLEEAAAHTKEELMTSVHLGEYVSEVERIACSLSYDDKLVKVMVPSNLKSGSLLSRSKVKFSLLQRDFAMLKHAAGKSAEGERRRPYSPSFLLRHEISSPLSPAISAVAESDSARVKRQSAGSCRRKVRAVRHGATPLGSAPVLPAEPAPILQGGR